ncbi:hypothetical protein CRT60_21745 [Azospirillum palustre]|uniref:Large polyvalent protein associated domain-containing protein n=1 Tax=Azospirillum palustre TaxID=2044885 RepID=A0A2B8BEA6_9PROT|nr:hypothetical protein [Azospirillum palustre]PGH55878.1 hypothetical protein CRT60_21745 [Azospirillum palustre]
MDFDTSGLTPLDTTGLTPAGNDLDVSGLTPLDTSGLMPLDRQPAAKGSRGLDMEKVRAETPPPSSTIPVDGAAEADRAWANTPFTDRVLNPLTAGVLSLKQGVAGLGADMSARSLAVMDRVDRGEAVPEMDDPVGYQQMTPEQRAAARRQAEADIGQSAGSMVQTGRRIADIPQNPAAQRMMGAKTWGDAASAFWSDPLGVIGSVGLQSLPAMAPALVAGTLGGPAAGAVAMGASSAGTEYLSSMIEGLSQEGVNVGSEQALVQAFRNPELMTRVRDRAATRAAIIGGVDGATGGLAGKTLVPARVKSTLAREVLNIPAQTVAQGAAGAGGEAGAQIATEGRITEPGQVLGEMVGEAFGAPAEVAALRSHAAAHPVEVAPPNVTPADVASPIPTDLISHGRSIVDDLLAPKPAPSMEPAPNVADLPQGAVPAEVLLGQVAEPEPVVSPPAEPVRPADPVTAPAAQSVDGLTPFEPAMPLEAPAIDTAPHPVADQAAPVDRLAEPSGSVAQASMADVAVPQLAEGAPPRPPSNETAEINTAAPALDVTGLMPREEAAPRSQPASSAAAEVAEAPDDFPGIASQLPQPGYEQVPATAVNQAPPPILKKDGTAFSTPQSAALAARSRPDLKGQALEPVQVEGGWGLRPVENGAQPTAQPADMTRPPSLFEFLASKGGIQDQAGELRALDLKRQFLPRQGALVRPRGLTLDHARELVEEAGYIRPSDRTEGFGRTEITDLLDAIDREGRGAKVYPLDQQADVAQQDRVRRQMDEEASRRADAEAGVRAVLEEYGVRLPEDLHRQAVEAAMHGLDHEDAAVEALERLAIQREADYIREGGTDVDPFPFEDITDAQQRGLQQEGGVAAAAGGRPESAGVRDNPEGTDRSRGGDGRRGEDRGQAGSGETPVNRATERTDQGEQFIVDGLRPVTDRDRIEAAMAKPMQPKKRQQAADQGLFDVGGRGQSDMFGEPPRRSAAEEVASAKAPSTNPEINRLLSDPAMVGAVRASRAMGEEATRSNTQAAGLQKSAGVSEAEWAAYNRYQLLAKGETPSADLERRVQDYRRRQDEADAARGPEESDRDRRKRFGTTAKAEQQLDRLLDNNRGLYDALHEAVGKMDDGDRFRLAPAFEQTLPNIGTDLAARLQRYGIADHIGLKLVDTIRDRDTNEPMDDAVGRYGRRVIEVALNSNSRTFTFDHEVIHGLRDLDLIRPAEWAALRRAVIQDRARMADVRARYPEFTRWGDRPEATDRLIEEGVADLFAEWQAGRVEAKGFVRTAMERIRDFLRAVGQTLRGLGFRTVDSVFRSIDRGEIGARSGGEAMAGGLAEAHHAQMQPRDEQGRFVPGAPGDRFSIERDDPAPQAAEARRGLMAKLAGAQPLDRVARIPFDLFGGINGRNEWQPGLYINKQAARILTEATFADGGKLGWMNGILHRARAGLIDRYGLDAAYVERDRQRQLDERRIMAKVPELMKTLVDQDVKPEEMATLQAVLTGEEVADARWKGIAAPIRQAIDQMGAEAVELGLLSPEAFERNRGKYLHRVYAKHEADQGSLTAWVDRKLTGRRRQIVGDQFKGRGMFMEVSHGTLMRNTDEAQTARERSGRLRALEKRRDELLRRRELALARTEERHDEMEATLGRRMDTSEDAKALKRPGGATVVLKPNRYQKGQAREQGVALTRLNMKGQRARALVDRINGQLADVNGRIVDTETRLFSADDLKASKGQKFRVLDKLAETEEGKPPRVLHRAYLPEGQAIPTEMEGYQDRGVWEVRGEKGGKPVLWRDFDKGERQSMGEIVDARYTVAKTYMLMAHDFSTGRFFRDIAASPEWSRDGKDEPPSATWKEAGEYSRFWADPAIQWVKVPDTKIPKSDTKRYGALSGRFVRAEIWRDMAELESMQKPGFWDAVLRQWKANKTFRSPVVHMNNIMSNVMFMDMADVRATDLVRGTRSLLKRDAAYREALDHGAFGSDLLAQEIREEVLKPILEEIERAAQGGQGEAQARFGVVGKLAHRLWSGAKAADGAMQRAYQMEDEFFRMALYLRRREQGQSPEQAALDARDTFLNYDIRAPWVNAARRSVLPFISYTYRAAPMIARTLATRPWKMAKYFTMMYALNALAYSLAPGDEDEERRSLRENEQGWAWTGVPRMMRLPTHDQHGNPVFLDMRRWIPAGDVFDTGQGQSVIPVPSWMQPGGPLAIGAELLLNRSAFTGQDIINKNTDTTGERAGKAAGYVYRSWMPSAAWVPGSWYWQSIGNAMDGARDWSGRPYSVPQAVANSVGIKIKPQDVQDGFAAWGREFDKTERELEALAHRAGRDRERGLLSEVGYQRQMEGLMEKMGELNKRRKETFTRSSR